jgi:hypothetical protein
MSNTEMPFFKIFSAPPPQTCLAAAGTAAYFTVLDRDNLGNYWTTADDGDILTLANKTSKNLFFKRRSGL